MGWGVNLSDENGIVKVPRHSAGSNIVIDVETGIEGQVEADMTVTYNYSPLYHLAVGKSLPDSLSQQKAKDTIPLLEEIVKKLGVKQYKRPRDDHPPLRTNEDFKHMFDDYIVDYWAPTMGNAGYTASILLEWAKLHPEAVWSVQM